MIYQQSQWEQGPPSLKHCFSSHVGIGSRAQDFVGDDVITFLTSDSETILKSSKDNPWNVGAVDGNWSVNVFKDSSRLLWISSILFLEVVNETISKGCSTIMWRQDYSATNMYSKRWKFLYENWHVLLFFVVINNYTSFFFDTMRGDIIHGRSDILAVRWVLCHIAIFTPLITPTA